MISNSFILLVLLLTTLYQPVNASKSFSNICDSGQTYIKRRLASQETDNICNKYSGKVLLIVNTASKCAFTNQYDGLEELYKRYKNEGLVVLGFPSNDFGGQEPGAEKKSRIFVRIHMP